MATIHVRREPPAFRRIEVRRTEPLSPRLLRITFGGADLAGLDIGLPAASVRLLLPPRGTAALVIPTWNGNEFLHADGERPTIRTYTPRRFDPDALELDLDVVLHERGVVSAWARASQPGDPAAISGPGRGYTIDGSARAFLLAGDESAVPAMSQLLEHLPEHASVHVIIEVGHPDARHALPSHTGATVHWCDLPPGAPPGDALGVAVMAAELDADVQVWAAGEAAAVHRIRRHLFEERGLARSQAVVRGYWKQGRGGDVDEG